jgi:RNA polymerase sigma factor (sigma-70 family)
MARRHDHHTLAEDLEQLCYVAVWNALVQDGPTFLLEAFMHTLRSVQQHVAHLEMEQLGEWKRPGVTTPTRVPSGEMQRLEAGPGAGLGGGAGARTDTGETSAATDVEDPTAADAFEGIERTSDIDAVLSTLDPDDRLLVYDVFYRDLTQQQIAEHLHVTDRTVRNRLTRIVQLLRTRYLGGEEGADHG